jgi:catechol 2,3-dioxygenase-like lactoylglutathione lyase family enzyme
VVFDGVLRVAKNMARLTSLVLRCSDLERSRAFYEQLGLRFTPEQHDTGPRHYSTQLGSTLLELYPQKAAVVPLRLGLAIDALAQRLESLGSAGAVIVSKDLDAGHALVRDPDGHTLDLTRD